MPPGTKSDMKRVFLALPLSEESALQLWQSWEPLRSSSRHLRWIEPGQLHLTLVFLWDVQEHLIPDIADIVEETGSHYSSIPLVTGGPGHFPSGGSPRILFESLEQGRTAVIKLQKHLSHRLSDVVELERRHFHPHITMVRIKQKNLIPPAYYPGVETTPVEGVFKEIFLYESILSPDGPLYHILHKTPLL